MDWFSSWLFLLGLMSPADPCEAVAVLDVQRAIAYSAGEPTVLERIYAAGPALEADRRILQGYVDRGYVVEGAHMEVRDCRVVQSRDRHAIVQVTDRLAQAYAIRDGDWRPLPRDRATTREVTLVRIDGQWRIQ